MIGFAWGFVAGYLVAKLIEMVGAIRSAKRDAKQRVAEARRDVIERGGHPSEKDIKTTGLPKLPPGPGPGSDVGASCTKHCGPPPPPDPGPPPWARELNRKLDEIKNMLRPEAP